MTDSPSNVANSPSMAKRHLSDSADSPALNQIPRAPKKGRFSDPTPIPPTPQKNLSDGPPNNNAETILHASSVFKSVEAVQTTNFMSSASNRVYCKTVANGIFHLFYVERLDGIESFVHPLLQQIESSGDSSSVKGRTKIIAVAPRRIDKQHNEPQMKAGQNSIYKKHYFVAMFPDKNSDKVKHAKEIAKVGTLPSQTKWSVPRSLVCISLMCALSVL